MAIAQRPRIGLKDLVYAVLDESTDITGGTPSYGTVYSLANAMELSFDPGSSGSILFGDDGPAFAAETVGEMKLSFGIADILPDHVNRILGHAYANGLQAKTTNDQSPYIAIGGKRLCAGSDAGNPIYEYFWLLKCRFYKPKLDGKTKGANIEYQTPMLEGLAVKLTANDTYDVRVRTDDAAAASATVTNFFNAPVISTGANLNALGVTGVAKSGSFAVITFAKTGGGNFTLSSPTLVSPNIRIALVSTGALQSPTYTTSATPAATQTATSSTLSAGTYLVTVDSGVKDNSGVGTTLYSGLVTI